jgi:hypothetical protein
MAKLEADNEALTEENRSLRTRFQRDSCGAGRKRGPHGCVDDAQ